MAKAAARLFPSCSSSGRNDARHRQRGRRSRSRGGRHRLVGLLERGPIMRRRPADPRARVDLRRLRREAQEAGSEALRVGRARDFDIDMGCIVSARQKDWSRLEAARCLAQGAKVIARSPIEPALEKGNFLPAIVLGSLCADSPRDAGGDLRPRRRRRPFKDDEEALRMANDSAMGLTASVWSRDRATARALAGRIRAGAVMVNDHLMSHGLAETPWGGVGDSGMGRTHAELGFLEMLQTRVVVDDILPGAKKDIWWQPYSEKVYEGLRSIIGLVSGPGISARIRGLAGLARFFFRYWDRS